MVLLYGTAKLKVPQGKLLSVKVTYWERIDDVQILGDFFVYPEESLSLIEKALAGTGAKAGEDEISGLVQSVVDRNSIVLVGITPEYIAKAIRMAIK